MRRRLRILPRAQIDLDAQRIYFALEAGDEVADRFRASVQRSMESLLDFPLKGAERPFGNPRLRELRAWPVEGFPRIYLFYRALPEYVEVVRILSPERDLGADWFE